MHSLDGLNNNVQNPVLKQRTPAVGGALESMYTIPGSFDFELSVLRACNTSGSDDTVSVALSTGSQTSPVYIEYSTTIAAGCSLDLFMSAVWFPPTAQFWVASGGGGVSFTLLGSEVGRDGGSTPTGS